MRFSLTGSVDQEELRDLEWSLRTVESTRGERRLIVDVRTLERIDEPVRTLLERLRDKGATIVHGPHALGSRRARWRRSIALLARKLTCGAKP